jgi:hypothetical protein
MIRKKERYINACLGQSNPWDSVTVMFVYPLIYESTMKMANIIIWCL